MEKIKKTINLEDVIIRFSPESGNTSRWGEIANDFIISDENLKNLPFLIEEKSFYRLRYNTMISIYYWLNNFIKSSKIYTICLRNDKLKAILIDENIDLSKYIGKDIIFSKTLPYLTKTCAKKNAEGKWDEYYSGEIVYCDDVDAKECYKIEINDETLCSPNFKDFSGKTIWVNEEIEYFFEFFLTGSTVENANNFLNYAISHKGGGKEDEEISGYIDMKIYVDDKVSDLGLFTADAGLWQYNKRYYLGDIAQDDNGDVYELIRCITSAETVENLKIDKMKVPTYLNDFIKEQLDDTGNTCYKSYTGICKDLYDISESNNPSIYIEGDYPNFYYVRAYYNGFIDVEHWRYKNGASGITENELGVSGITESKLKSLRRRKKSYDDESNELPFIIIESGNKRITDLVYSEDTHMNVLNIGDKTYYDYISVISSDTEYIYFVYYIGCCDGVNDGVRYEEHYRYKNNTLTCYYNGKQCKFEYCDIDYTCIIDYDKMELDKNKLYSIYYVDSKTIESDDFQDVLYFKDENLMGIQKINKEIEINVERGKSAALERHQVLGEVSSFDDLITYKNGFFTLKSD